VCVTNRRAHLTLLALCAVSAACSPYVGSASRVRPEQVRQERDWVLVEHVPTLRQRARHDCGPTALAMVVRYLEPERDLAHDRFFAGLEDRHVAVSELRNHARSLGLTAFVVEGTPDDLLHELHSGRPVIVGVGKPTLQGTVFHYEVVIGYHRRTRRILMIDPAEGWLQNSFEGFVREWQASGRALLVVMPTAR
jgi:ABC-type bacteriocin/lantibiotic exporter with double-glycine peptidase domain